MKFGVMVQDDELHKMLVYFSWAGIAFFFFQVLTWLISWNLFDFRSGLILQRTSKCAAAVLACTTVSRTPGWRLLPTRIALARSFRTAPRFTSWPSPRWWTTNSPLLNSNRLPNAISSPVLKPVPAGNSEEYYGENECVEVRCCRCRLTLSVYFIPHAILYTFFVVLDCFSLFGTIFWNTYLVSSLLDIFLDFWSTWNDELKKYPNKREFWSVFQLIDRTNDKISTWTSLILSFTEFEMYFLGELV